MIDASTQRRRCKYRVGQTLLVGVCHWNGERRTVAVHNASVVNVEPSNRRNSSRVWLRVAHDDCYEDMRVDTRWLTRMVKNAESAAAPA